MRTSWTDTNPGRRFIGWQQKHEDCGCGFFVWYDPPMCGTSKMVISGLLKTLRKTEVKQRGPKKWRRCFELCSLQSGFCL
ncbi:hypothetical protein RHMOL_Rhmol07G0201100 [Rhododendron molle]|uniref:Uncharacterized protein n=1 Tax=Rhododendron molle TaxID=49168 RepID=A0ACC0N2L9_RHOML|nr:hypothetical protein RHMOL_Rhmol07G0201100 [Rhododendron molle]